MRRGWWQRAIKEGSRSQHSSRYQSSETVSEMDRKPEGAKDFARANFGKAWQDRINTLYSKAYEMWRVCLHNNRSGNSAVLVQDDNGSWHVFLSEENMQWPIKFAVSRTSVLQSTSSDDSI